MSTTLPEESLPPRGRKRKRAVAPIVAALASAVAFATFGVGCQPAQFRPVFHDDFSGTELNENWFTYRGSPLTDANATWTADRVRLENGAAVIDAIPAPGRPGHWEIGGMANHGHPLTYGRWTVRFRATSSSIISYHLLLTPDDQSWPPEIDIAEGWEDRSINWGFLHYIDSNGQYQRPYHNVAGDFTQWQTVSVSWTPTRVAWSLNGQEWAAVTGDAVPHVPMRLSLQIETQTCDRSVDPCDVDTVTPAPRLEIDDVVVEAYVPPAPATTTTTAG